MLRRLLVVGFALSLSVASRALAQEALASSIATSASSVPAAIAEPDPAPAAVLSEHVIVVSIDGLRADAIEAAGAETLIHLMNSGSSTLAARTIQPSRTLPSHTSMLTGVTPEAHGITWNSDRTDEVGTVSVPTVFEVAHRAGYRTAGFFGKSKFAHLVRDDSFDKVRVPESGVLPAERTVREATSYMERERPNLLFVHIAEPDFLGHRLGWMSIGYRWAVREADAAVAEIIEVATETYGEGGFTLIVTADHGGHGRDHGTEDNLDTTIPWISWGRGIRSEHSIAGTVRTMDTAATVLRVLGLAVPGEWVGVPVGEALMAPLRAVAVDGQP